MEKIKVGIINVTGYAGVELARLLYQHPGVTLASVTGRSTAGQSLGQVFPHLTGMSLNIESALGEVSLAFSAMPHKESVREVVPLLDRGVKVVDISADFRLKRVGEYQSWYGFSHPAPKLLAEAAYGLPELHRSDISTARLVANPGCYPTAAILALAPAIKEGLVEPNIVIDSKSGISGTGRTISLNTHFAEANEDVTAYALEGHRHLPEITQELGLISPGASPAITFVPHLIPMTRGILTTAYAPLVPGKVARGKQGEVEIRQLYLDFYSQQPFVRVTEASPHTKHTAGNNLCLVYPTVDPRTERLVVISCIDNLLKGAAGQAIQNMNLMLDLPETTGLTNLSIYP